MKLCGGGVCNFLSAYVFAWMCVCFLVFYSLYPSFLVLLVIFNTSKYFCPVHFPNLSVLCHLRPKQDQINTLNRRLKSTKSKLADVVVNATRCANSYRWILISSLGITVFILSFCSLYVVIILWPFAICHPFCNLILLLFRNVSNLYTTLAAEKASLDLDLRYFLALCLPYYVIRSFPSRA